MRIAVDPPARVVRQLALGGFVIVAIAQLLGLTAMADFAERVGGNRAKIVSLVGVSFYLLTIGSLTRHAAMMIFAWLEALRAAPCAIRIASGR